MINYLQSVLTYEPDSPMLFNSGLFWVLFMIFLPIYGMLRNRKATMMVYVIAFSLFFYYKSSGAFCLLLIARTVIDYYISHWLARSDSKAARRALLTMSLLLSLGTLGYFKYANFFMENISVLFSTNFQPLDLVLPVGISFYTFQSISYVVDVYKGKTGQSKSLLEYLFFLSFFPALVAGPIVRSTAFLPQIYNKEKIGESTVFSGMVLIMIGLVKKAIVADYLAQFNNMVFGMPDSYSGFECLMAVLGFSVQIFCDFSGYSDIAIGISRIMGFELGDNFRSPYKSLSITEFWRRWHISLSSWLRDYVYIPLGGNRKGSFRTYLNLMITMLVGGIWHGAGWQFIIWGGMHGVGLVIHKLKSRFFPVQELRGIRLFVSWLGTFAFVTLLWVFFRAESTSVAVSLIGRIFTDFTPEMVLPFMQTRCVWVGVCVFAFIAIFTPLKAYQWVEKRYISSNIIVKIIIFAVLVQLILEFAGTEVAPFIYFQF